MSVESLKLDLKIILHSNNIYFIYLYIAYLFYSMRIIGDRHLDNILGMFSTAQFIKLQLIMIDK